MNLEFDVVTNAERNEVVEAKHRTLKLNFRREAQCVFTRQEISATAVEIDFDLYGCSCAQQREVALKDKVVVVGLEQRSGAKHRLRKGFGIEPTCTAEFLGKLGVIHVYRRSIDNNL